MSNQKPIFIPRVIDATIAELDIKFPVAMIDADHIFWRPKIISYINLIAEKKIINPITYKLLLKDAKDGVNFKKIGYPQEIDEQKIYSDSTFRYNNIVKVAVDFQIKNGADIIIAPYFFTPDIDDIKFGLNISMISETIRYMEKEKIKKPVFGMILIGNQVFAKPTVVNYIISRYNDDFSTKLEGYFIGVDELDPRTASLETLLGYSYLVFSLSYSKEVIVKRIGSFGEVLCALGAKGICTSLAGGESLSIKNLHESPEGFKATKKTYIPEIFDYLNDEAVKKIKYSCNCKSCNGNAPENMPEKKRHILFSRMERIRSLQEMKPPQKIKYMQSQLEQASTLANKFRNTYGVDVKLSHLDRWYNLLIAASKWAPEDSKDELENLLKELDS